MKFNNICGIYRIINNVTEEQYIGKSINIGFRWSGHVRDLSENVHCNKYFQKLYNKYGIESFKFEVVERDVNESYLHLREWWWLQNSLIESNSGLINRDVSTEYSTCRLLIENNILEYKSLYPDISERDLKIKILQDNKFIKIWYNGDMEFVYKYNMDN